MTTYIMRRGAVAVGRLTTEPYGYDYYGDDSLVKAVLEEGPPEQEMIGAETPDANANGDQLRDLSPDERVEAFRPALGSVGIELVAPNDTKQ